MQLELIETVRYGNGDVKEEVVDFDQQRKAIEAREAVEAMKAEWEAENWATDALTGFAYDPFDPFGQQHGPIAATAAMMASIDGDGEFWDSWKDQMKEGFFASH